MLHSLQVGNALLDDSLGEWLVNHKSCNRMLASSISKLGLGRIWLHTRGKDAHVSTADCSR
eukprot:2103376-Amphidinium_carterae.1